MKQYPPLHGKEFGGEVEGSIWIGRFSFTDDNQWEFAWLDDKDNKVEELTSIRPSPRDAFNEVVRLHTYFNEGKLSPVLQVILPTLEAFFNDDGSVKIEHLIAL